MSTEFAGHLLLAAITLAVITYILVRVMEHFIVFTRDLRIPSEKSFIVGTLLSLFALTYVVYNANHYYNLTRVLMLFIFFLVLYIIWCANMAVSAEYHSRGARAQTAGSFYIISCILTLLSILYYSSQVSLGVSMLTLLPLSWCIYLLYTWWFRYAPWNVSSRAVPVKVKC